MESSTLLMEPTAELSVPSPPPRLDFRDIQRSFVMLSSFRSGSDMLKASLAQLAGIAGGPEPFNPGLQSREFYTLPRYLDERVSGAMLLTDGHVQFHQFLANYFAHETSDGKVLIDIKYPQAYAFGVNVSMDLPAAVPIILEEFAKLQVPFVHLTRRDLVAQSCALLIDENGDGSALGEASSEGRAEQSLVRLAPRHVFERAMQLKNGRDNARAMLGLLGAKVFEVTYESLLAGDGKEVYRSILRFVGRYADFPSDFVPPSQEQNALVRLENLTDIRSYISNRDHSLNG